MKINQLVYIVVVILILAGLFFIFKPKPSPQLNEASNSNLTTSENTISPDPSVSKVKIFEVVIQSRKIVSGPQTLSLIQGDEVTIKITSDEDEEFHVHAYDNSVELKAGKTVELKFAADKSGRFPFELEKSKTEIGVLEVQPR